MKIGKPMYFDRSQFFQGFEDKDLKEKVSEIKVFYCEFDDEHKSIAFACEGEKLTLDEKKRLEAHFEKHFDINKIEKTLTEYYGSLMALGIDPIESDAKNCIPSSVIIGKPIAVDRNEFLKGFDDAALKEKVSGVSLSFETKNEKLFLAISIEGNGLLDSTHSSYSCAL